MSIIKCVSEPSQTDEGIDFGHRNEQMAMLKAKCTRNDIESLTGSCRPSVLDVKTGGCPKGGDQYPKASVLLSTEKLYSVM